MSSLTRRDFVQVLLGMAAVSGGCGRTGRSDRELVLEALVRDVAVPDARAIVKRSAELVTALRALPSSAAAEQLEPARAALRGSILAWQRAYAFRNGPIVETSAYLRSAFWPVRVQALREVVEDASGASIGQGLIDELGVDVKGVFALEELLFNGPESNGRGWLQAGVLSAEQETRARAFAVALAQDVAGRATAAQNLLQDGAKFAGQFAQAGQASINLLVNQMIATLEQLAARRLEHVLTTYENDSLRLAEVQGGRAGLSSEIPRCWLQTTQALYAGQSGKGLQHLLAQAAPAIEQSVTGAFSRATAALARIAAPLEQVVSSDRDALAQAAQAVKALETALRVELTSALGVTLTFVAADGD